MLIIMLETKAYTLLGTPGRKLNRQNGVRSGSAFRFRCPKCQYEQGVTMGAFVMKRNYYQLHLILANDKLLI